MFRILKNIILFILFSFKLAIETEAASINIEFLGDSIPLNIAENMNVAFENSSLSDESITAFYEKLSASDYQSLIAQLNTIKENYQLNDWLFYQLVRKTAQEISPKDDNYYRYTLYKWFLMSKSGYDATLSYCGKYLLFYVRSEDNIYGIPFFEKDQHQYICLNYHDYDKIDFTKEAPQQISVDIKEGQKAFSYKITQMPDFKPSDYAIKELQFNYQDKVYHFKVKLNPQVKSLFTNYPVADFETYFNIPLSKETYSSLIPVLKNAVSSLKQKDGVDFLMRFTRYSFLYESDQENFGKEKRLSPEQTLLYEYSDCDDRAALFFYLVKELYNLPMIVLLYPSHVTIAVQFDNPSRKGIVYKGKTYSNCDPTPQAQDTKVGQIDSIHKHQSYEVVYEYNPVIK